MEREIPELAESRALTKEPQSGQGPRRTVLRAAVLSKVHVGGTAPRESIWNHQRGFCCFKDFIYFLETGEGREKQRERNIDVREKH